MRKVRARGELLEYDLGRMRKVALVQSMKFVLQMYHEIDAL